jgi:tetratricopeptide (TPR) repeat protein
MADEVLRLGVDPTPAVDGFRLYDQAAERTIAKSDQLARSIERVSNSYEVSARELQSRGISAAEYMRPLQEAHAEALRMNAAMEATGGAATRSTAGIGRLNLTLASLARQATGTHPAMSQLANVASTFAVGTVATTGVLAGLALTAAAIRLIGREARDTRERLREAVEALDKFSGFDPLGGQVAMVRAQITRLENEQRALVAERAAQPQYGYDPLRRMAIQTRLQGIGHELGTLRPRVSGGQRELEDRSLAELNASVSGAGPSAYRLREIDRDIQRQIKADELALEKQYAAERLQITREFAAETERVRTTGPGGMSAAIGQREYEEAVLQAAEAEERALQLARDRAAANDALVLSLENVGRAYGGVVDQIAALTAATIRMYQAGPLPMESLGDKATAYGSAALTGVGFGVSTGNPALGAGGGAAAGFATAGPWGAVAGGVAGLVSSLWESGRRAEEARRVWRNALDDFDLMFDNLSEIEASMASLDRAFRELAGGRSVDEVRVFLASLYDLRDVYGSSLGPALDEQIERYEALLGIYDENAEQAREAAEANSALTDTYRELTSALNSPSGLRLSLYRWMASGVTPGQDTVSQPRFGDDLGTLGGSSGGSRPSTYVINGPLTIQVSGVDEPAAVADAVFDEIGRRARRGGSDPLYAPTR